MYDKPGWFIGRQHLATHFVMTPLSEQEMHVKAYSSILQHSLDYRGNFVFGLASWDNVCTVPRDAPLHYMAGFTCGVQTGAGVMLNAIGVAPHQTVAVFGAGAVGLAAVMAAGASGAREIVAVDRVRHRLDLAL